ncbi:MAG: putative manganese-dependent inorganic diphosphatase [Salinispira sp.]
MKTVYITGHINPDLDCTAASYAYAYLKNTLDPETTYIPMCCGPLNKQTRAAFKKAEITPPSLYKKLIPVVADVIRQDYISLQADAPVLEALQIMYSGNISFIPVLEKEKFLGAVSINEVALYLGRQSDSDRPIYKFRRDNIPKVLPGTFIQKGACEEFEAPIWAGNMPFAAYVKWSTVLNQKPILVVGNRKKILSHAIENNYPAIIIPGVSDFREIESTFSGYSGTVYLAENDSAECMRLLRMSVPVITMTNRELPYVQKDEGFEDVKRRLMSSDFRGLPVFDGETFIGIVTRRRFVEKPLKEIILIDHNEIHQSVPGAREARVIEIIDHHRLGAEKTNTPIYIDTRPVGSTSTIIYEHFMTSGEKIPQDIAIILQSGIISDTVNLKSPTTTQSDIQAAHTLSTISGLSNDDYALEMFSQLTTLKKREPQDIINSDFKTYQQFGINIGIGQVEVINLREALKMTSLLSRSLDSCALLRSLDWALLLITDVLKHNSILVSSDFARGISLLSYQSLNDRTFDLPHILSRKKQVLPEILRIAEELE